MTGIPHITGAGRRGATLVEALVATVLAAVVLGAALDAVVRVARVRREHEARASARAQLAQAATALTSDFRPLTTVAAGDDSADLRALADTAVEVMATVGGGVTCAVAPAAGGAGAGVGSTIELAGAPGGSSTLALAWWTAPPRAGDVVAVHDDAGTATRADDRWTVRTVRAVSEGTTYCRSGPFAAASGGASRVRLTLDLPLLPATVGAGAPLRVARRRRFSLYRATEGWQLGVRDWDGSMWETVQPVAGPFDAPAARGLHLEAIGATGTAVQVPAVSGVEELRVLLRTSCNRYDRRLRCTDSTVAVVRPRGST
ncbi:MAG TPA: hypothetical protein VGD56_18560 [Gemmatirosa sp.]